MRVSYNWLRELLPGLTSSPSELAARLTALGLEVEQQIEIGAGLDNVKLCAVQGVAPVPERDKLRLVDVDLGGSTQQVVCGASNVPATGGLVVLAPLGTTLTAVGLTLKPRKLAGIVSEGMLCSEVELGLASDADGILTFEAGRFASGTPLYEAFPSARDTVFELGITPNRPDALGHVGVARDLAAALGLSLALPDATLPDGVNRIAFEDCATVENRAPELCPRYGAAVVKGLKVAPSPEWLRWRLHALGIRPISNVVDITNLLLLERGNPMHAFDLKRVAGARIVVRQATAGEKMTTLDDVERQLTTEDLVIADAQRAQALGGVMGGADSEIRTETSDVLLECAYFEPTGIRRSARRLGLHSDSSFRFERGVDWAALPHVLHRAARLLVQLAGAREVSSQHFADGAPPPLPRIKLRHARLEGLLGCEVPFVEALRVLTSLGLTSESDAKLGEAWINGASWRPDISLEADLIEEIARVRGLDAIPTVLPRISPRAPSSAGRLEREVRQHACALGLSEAVTYAFVAESDLKAVHAPPPVVRLQHPLSTERSVMATSLLPGLLDCVGRACRRGEPNVRLFTVASRFLPPTSKLPDAHTQAARPRVTQDLGALPEERLSFAAVLSGERPAYLSKAVALDVYDAKGIVNDLVERCVGRAPSVRWVDATYAHLHPRSAAEVFVGDTCVGRLGTLHPDVVERLELDEAPQVIELDLVALERIERSVPKYKPIPRLPAVTRDVAVEASDTLSAGQIESAISASAGELCESVELFDVFRNEQMKSGVRSLAFRIVYRDPKSASAPDQAKTLTDKRVDKQQAKVVKAIEALGATLRT